MPVPGYKNMGDGPRPMAPSFQPAPVCVPTGLPPNTLDVALPGARTVTTSRSARLALPPLAGRRPPIRHARKTSPIRRRSTKSDQKADQASVASLGAAVPIHPKPLSAGGWRRRWELRCVCGVPWPRGLRGFQTTTSTTPSSASSA